jgi:hypothetical protein
MINIRDISPVRLTRQARGGKGICETLNAFLFWAPFVIVHDISLTEGKKFVKRVKRFSFLGKKQDNLMVRNYICQQIQYYTLLTSNIFASEHR